jgi:hypothetical protein
MRATIGKQVFNGNFVSSCGVSRKRSASILVHSSTGREPKRPLLLNVISKAAGKASKNQGKLPDQGLNQLSNEQRCELPPSGGRQELEGGKLLESLVLLVEILPTISNDSCHQTKRAVILAEV